MNPDAHSGVERLFGDIQEGLKGPLRPLVPHGFTIEQIETTDRPNAFMPDVEALTEHETRATLNVPVIWEVANGRPTRASDTPTTENLDELRGLVTQVLASGEYWELRAGELADWSATLPEGPHPSADASWTVEAVIRST